MYLNSAFESKHPVYNRIEQSQVIKICENTIGICRAFNWNRLLADWLLTAWLLTDWLAFGWLAFGGLAFGSLAFNGLAFGSLAFDGLAFGWLAFDGLAIYWSAKNSACFIIYFQIYWAIPKVIKYEFVFCIYLTKQERRCIIMHKKVWRFWLK